MQVAIDLDPATYDACERKAREEHTTLSGLIARLAGRFSTDKGQGPESISMDPLTGLPIINGLPLITSDDVRACELEDDVR
ncbi:MAG: hypothetical protein ACOYMN_20140 [Roseimicrobium sp.]